jgi:hypothetical protein
MEVSWKGCFIYRYLLKLLRERTVHIDADESIGLTELGTYVTAVFI